MGSQKQCSACGVTFNSCEDKVTTLPGEKTLCGLPECRNKVRDKHVDLDKKVIHKK